MIKAIPMEDWLRGCIYHDGRHGYVTLPIDKVHQIANYIQRTRRSTTDGLIDLEVVEADRKTEPQTCDTCKWGEWYRKGYDITMMSDECGGCCSWNNKWTPKTEPQTHDIRTETHECVKDTHDKVETMSCQECNRYEPEVDCSWK